MKIERFAAEENNGITLSPTKKKKKNGLGIMWFLLERARREVLVKDQMESLLFVLEIALKFQGGKAYAKKYERK